MAQGRHTLMDPPIEEGSFDKVDLEVHPGGARFGPGPSGEFVLQQPRRGVGQSGSAPGRLGVRETRLHRLRRDPRPARRTFTWPDPEEEAALAAATSPTLAEAGLLGEVVVEGDDTSDAELIETLDISGEDPTAS